MSDDGNTTLLGETFASSPIGDFMERMFPGATASLAETRDVEFVRVLTEGARQTELIGLKSEAVDWKTADEYQALSLAASESSGNFLETIYNSRPVRAERLGDRTVLTNSEITWGDQGAALGPADPVAVSTTIEDVFGDLRGLADEALASLSDPRGVDVFDQKLMVPTATFASKLAAIARACGRVMVPGARVQICDLNLQPGMDDAGSTLADNRYFVQYGIQYVFINLSTLASQGTYQDDFTELLGVGDNPPMTLGIPVRPGKGLYHTGLPIDTGYGIVGEEIRLGDHRYQAEEEMSSDITQTPIPLWGGDELYLLDVPDVPVSDVLNLTVPTSIPIADGDTYEKVDAPQWREVTPSLMLPIVSPPGDVEFFLDVEWPDSVETEVIGVHETSGFEVRVHTVRPIAQREIIGIPYAWYEEYLSTGFGVYKPLEGETLTDALNASQDLAGTKVCVVTYDEPFALPGGLVKELELYRTYKKDREEACKTNDFMEKTFASGIKWGAVDKHFNELSGGVREFVSIRPNASTAALTLPDVGEDFSGVTITFDGTELVAEGEPSVNPMNAEELMDAIIGGADDSAVSQSDYDEALGVDTGATVASSRDAATQQKSDSADFRRGRGSSLYDFSWESLGINGYPLFDELSYQDALKMVVKSEMLYKRIGARMATAVTDFGTDALLSHLTKEE